MPSASTTLPAEASSVPTARRWVESLLSGWGLPEAGWAAAQVVSELATNCALHARSDYTIVVRTGPEGVRLEVSDSSPVPLQRRQYSETATTGRGLGIVDALALDWGVEQRDQGKTVWALLPSDDSPPAAGDDAQEARPRRLPRRSAPGDMTGGTLLAA